MLAALIIALVVAIIVYFVAAIVDKTPDDRYAMFLAFLVGLLVFLYRVGFDL